MEINEIKEAVTKAISSLQKESPSLDLSSVHERAIVHRLAVHLESDFIRWNVDCEYDRDDKYRKFLTGIRDCDNRTTDAIFPDIIVHRRRARGRENNLLVIEVKKSNAEDVCDRRKLELLTDPLGHFQYRLGLYMNITGGSCVCTWYRDGHRE